MTSKLGKTVYVSFLCVLLTFGLALSAQADEITIDIDVAPNVLNLGSSGKVVTVHTDIAYGFVTGASVFLNGVSIDWWKADNQGNFVAKFVMDAIKDLPLFINDYNTLTLTGKATDESAFIGTQDILVIDVKPQGRT